MKKLLPIFVAATLGLLSAGCSGGDADTESAPKGDPPEIKQAEPGMVPPEQRARESMGPGEGSR